MPASGATHDDGLMEGRTRRHLGRLRPSLVIAAGALVVNVVAAALFSLAAPYVDFLGLSRVALPGLSLGGAAAAVAVIVRAPLAVASLVTASCAAAAPALAIGLQQRSGLWVAVDGFAALLAPALVVIALLHPTGALTGRGRAIAGGILCLGAAAVASLTLTTDPAAWGWCRCAFNPLAVATTPDTSQTLASVVAAGQVGVLLVGVLALIPRALRRRTWVTIAFGGTFVVLLLSWGGLAVDEMVGSGSVPLAAEVRDAAVVALAALFVVGLTQQRPSRAHVADLLLAVREPDNRGRLRELVARALGDPDTTVAWFDSPTGDFLDDRGGSVSLPGTGVLRVEVAGRPIAVVIAEQLDVIDPQVRDSVAEALLLAAENRRLDAELRASLAQTRESRARILSASDDTRRRIERDLHDGAQQLLISTGIMLNLAAAQAGRGEDAELVQVIDEASEELNRGLAELRRLAGGIAPTALLHGSLHNALAELALRSPVPVTVRVTGDGAPPAGVSATIYFVVAECLANIAKHAEATRGLVDVELGDPARLCVSDDGVGGATLYGAGTGLRGLVDRVEALGGTLELNSNQAGTTVRASVPTGSPSQDQP
jgi:signal transduction histidine kinase